MRPPNRGYHELSFAGSHAVLASSGIVGNESRQHPLVALNEQPAIVSSRAEISDVVEQQYRVGERRAVMRREELTSLID